MSIKYHKTTIRTSESGWVVYFGDDVNNFKLFRSDEPERFIKFITENIAGIKIDALIAYRQAEMQAASRRLDEQQVKKPEIAS